MRRRSRLAGRASVLAAFAIALGSATAVGQQADERARLGGGPSTERPNVLLIITDDQRVQTLRGMPKTHAAFAKPGTTYKEAYTVSNACCPSRASIYTGKYPHNHGVDKNGEAGNLDQSTTLQSYLDAEGYQTAISGKYFVKWVEDPPHFDRFSIHQGGPGSYFYGGDWNINGVVKKVDMYSTDFVTRRSLSYLDKFERSDDTPWFLVVTPTAPHFPATPSKKYEDAPVPPMEGNPSSFEADLSDKPEYVTRNQVGPRRAKILRAKQIRTLMSVDDLVGRLNSKLTELDEQTDTVAIYTSDSGYSWGDHGLISKANPYTPATRIPLMVRAPVYFDEGSTNHDLVASIDIAPTVMDLVGIQPPTDEPMDGNSLLDGVAHERVLLRNPIVGTYSTRTAEYQFTQTGSGGDLFEEYYDLEEDEYQLENLLADGIPGNDPNLNRLRLELTSDKNCRGETCP